LGDFLEAKKVCYDKKNRKIRDHDFRKKENDNTKRGKKEPREYIFVFHRAGANKKMLKPFSDEETYIIHKYSNIFHTNHGYSSDPGLR